MADVIYPTQTPNTQDFDGVWHTFGVRFSLSSAGILDGGRAWYPTSDPADFRWLVYRESDQVIMAQVDLDALFSNPINSAWNSFTSASFQTPGNVSLAASTNYIVATATNGDFVYRSPFTWPISNGIITADQGRFHNGGSAAVFPEQSTTTEAFFADVSISTSGGVIKGNEFFAFFH